MRPDWHWPGHFDVERPPSGAPACWLHPSADVARPAAPGWKMYAAEPLAVKAGSARATRFCGVSCETARVTRMPMIVSWSCAPRSPRTLIVHAPYAYEPLVRSTKNCDTPAVDDAVLSATVLPAASTRVRW